MSNDGFASKKDFILIKPSDREIRRNYNVEKWTSQISAISDFLSTDFTEF